MPPFVSVGSALRNRAGLVLIAVGLALVIGAVPVLLEHPQYRATATLLVDERAESSQGIDVAVSAAQVMAQQYIDEMTDVQFLDEICAMSSVRSAGVSCSGQQLQGQLQVTLAAGTYLIDVSVTQRSPHDAAVLANAIAGQIVAIDRSQANRLVGTSIQGLQAQLSHLSTQIDTIRNTIATDSPTQLSAASTQLSILEAEYSTVYTQLQQLQQQRQTLSSDLSIIHKAAAPSKPVLPSGIRDLGVALVFGLLVGCLAALVVERRDHRIRDGVVLAQAAGVDIVMEDLPASRPEDDAVTLGLATLLSRHAEARAVLAVAASASDDVALMARKLARACSNAGGQVALLCESSSGTGDQRLLPEGDGYSVAHPEASELPRMFEQARKDYDYVFVAVPTPGRSLLGILLSSKADLVLLAATAARTQFDDVQRTADLLRGAGASLVGAILAPTPRRRRGGGGFLQLVGSGSRAERTTRHRAAGDPQSTGAEAAQGSASTN